MRQFEKVSYRQFEKDFMSEFPEAIYEEIQGIYEDLKLPERATDGSIGYGFFAPFNFDLKPGEEIKFPTGIKVELDPHLIIMTVDQDGVSLPLCVYEWLGIYPRSGQGFKFLRIANTVGVIDFDYYNNSSNEGEIWIKLRNESVDKIFEISKGQEFCQGIINLSLRTSNDKSTGIIREGGLGSTDA
jgi:dUTP pyrophosphatase